jgi:NNP family nitrate/nitrite transporter-like MFS transporter
VPLRWPTTTAVAGSMIGEIGALGGGLVPNLMGTSKQNLGSYGWGFITLAAVSLTVLVALRMMQVRWTRTWAEKGGRARAVPAMPTVPAMPVATAPARIAANDFSIEATQGVQP